MHLLIDGRNCSYRAAWAYLKGSREGHMKYHPFVYFMRQLGETVSRFKPNEVTCVWDAPRETVWRREIFPLYKQRDDDNKYVADLREPLKQIETVARILLPEANVRDVSKATQETDDLIYSLCRVIYPKEVIIVSSDRDFLQIPYRMPGVRQFEPQDKEFLLTPDLDPVVTKSLIGDPSDRIDGYHGIGKVKAGPLASCFIKRQAFLEANGPSLYYRNLVLIDLANNPDRLKNDMHVSAKLAEKPRFDAKKIDDLIVEHRIFGLKQDYDRAVRPFKTDIRPIEEETVEKKPKAKSGKTGKIQLVDAVNTDFQEEKTVAAVEAPAEKVTTATSGDVEALIKNLFKKFESVPEHHEP